MILVSVKILRFVHCVMISWFSYCIIHLACYNSPLPMKLSFIAFLDCTNKPYVHDYGVVIYLMYQSFPVFTQRKVLTKWKTYWGWEIAFIGCKRTRSVEATACSLRFKVCDLVFHIFHSICSFSHDVLEPRRNANGYPNLRISDSPKVLTRN